MSDANPVAVLSTMQPDPTWDAESYDAEVQRLARKGLTFRIWGGDWCPDCRQQLPQFAAALDAAGVPEARIQAYSVDRENGEKVGEGLEEYGVSLIPTVVVEDASGEEIARYVEEEAKPIAGFLSDKIDAA